MHVIRAGCHQRGLSTKEDLNEELQARLASPVVELNTLSQEYTMLMSKLEVSSKEILDAHDMLAQYKADVEIVEAQIIMKIEYVRWLSHREALEEN